ncbi:hypothetical protein LINPERHAP2_LOCUS17110 [Linum perenne]
MAWIIWKARNNLVFEDIKDSVEATANKCRYWINLILTSWKTNQLGQEAPGLARQALLVAWWPRDEGWSILNTDGSRYHSNRSTAIGGVLQDRDIKISHVFREANQAADYMVTLGHSFDFGIHFFSTPDPLLCNWLRYDHIGVALPRLVHVNN